MFLIKRTALTDGLPSQGSLLSHRLVGIEEIRCTQGCSCLQLTGGVSIRLMSEIEIALGLLLAPRFDTF